MNTLATLPRIEYKAAMHDVPVHSYHAAMMTLLRNFKTVDMDKMLWKHAIILLSNVS